MNLDLSEIKEAVDVEFDIDISKDTRLREYSDARAIYYGLARELTYNSLTEIGKLVNRHHASVIHGVQNILHLVNSKKYAKLRRKLLNKKNEDLSINSLKKEAEKKYFKVPFEVLDYINKLESELQTKYVDS